MKGETHGLRRDLVTKDQPLDERSGPLDQQELVSALALSSSRRSLTVIQPQRQPGATVFEKDARSRTRPSVSIERKPGMRGGGVGPWVAG